MTYVHIACFDDDFVSSQRAIRVVNPPDWQRSNVRVAVSPGERINVWCSVADNAGANMRLNRRAASDKRRTISESIIYLKIGRADAHESNRVWLSDKQSSIEEKSC